MSVSANTDKPSCFGTLWDPKSTECRGGPDPSYIDPRNGNNVREQCSFFGSCGTHTQGARLEAARRQQNVIPPQALVRPEVSRFQQSYPQQPTPAPTTTYQIPVQPQQQQYHPPQQQQRGYSPPAPSYVPPAHVAVPVYQEHFNPGQYQPLPVNYGIPSYLSVPETRTDHEGIVPFAFRSIARSMLKGGAHGLAHLIDVTPLRRKPKSEGETR